MAAGYVIFLLGTLMSIITAVPVNTQNGQDDLTVASIDYLARLGYYTIPDAKLGALASETDIRKSLKSLQRFAGIPETGKLDATTKKLIQTPRCGMPDMSKNLGTRKRRYTLQGSTWKKTDLTWRLVNDNNDGLSRREVEDVLHKAFSKWHAVTNLNFQKLERTTSGPVDIEVKFVQNYHQDPYPFDGAGGTLAHAFYPHNNKGLSGDVHFDDAETFTIGRKSGRSLLWVAVHEIGHSIGLEHSNVQEAIMYPWYRGFSGLDFDLHSDDITGIQYIYGGRVGPTKATPSTKAVATKATKSTKRNFASCPAVFKAVFLDKSSKNTYIINDDKVYILNSKLQVEKGPVQLKKLFPGLDRADSVYRRGDGRIVFFKDTTYYVYESVARPRLVDSGSIFNKYRGLSSSIERIDAAFVWSGNGRTYLFAGKDYYRYDERRNSMDRNYPREITSAWKGVPSHVDSVFIWTNDITYFFKGSKYYRLNNNNVRVESGYPKTIAGIWTKCTGGLVGDSQNSAGGITVNNSFSLFLSVILALLVKLLQ